MPFRSTTIFTLAYLPPLSLAHLPQQKTPFKLAILYNKSIADAHPSFLLEEAILGGRMGECSRLQNSETAGWIFSVRNSVEFSGLNVCNVMFIYPIWGKTYQMSNMVPVRFKLCRIYISETAGRIYTVWRSMGLPRPIFVQWKVIGHLPHKGLPMGQNRVKSDTSWVQTLRNAYMYLWTGRTDFFSIWRSMELSSLVFGRHHGSLPLRTICSWSWVPISPTWACPWARMHIPETAGWIVSIVNSRELSSLVVQRYEHLPICPMWGYLWTREQPGWNH